MATWRTDSKLFVCAALAGVLLTVHTTGLYRLDLRESLPLTGCGTPLKQSRAVAMAPRSDIDPSVHLRRKATVRELKRGTVLSLTVEREEGPASYHGLILVGTRAGSHLVLESFDGVDFQVPLSQVADLTVLSVHGQAANAPLQGALAGGVIGLSGSIAAGSRINDNGCSTILLGALLVPVGLASGAGIGSAYRAQSNRDVHYDLRGNYAWQFVAPIQDNVTPAPDSVTPTGAPP
jgi:hypothetical protein